MSSFVSSSDIVATLRAAGCVFAEEEARLLIAEARTPDELGAMVDRRAAGVPLEYVVGWAEFCGLRIALDEGVFVPRRRTEFLVHQAADAVRRTAGSDRPVSPVRTVIVDLCCGSGAVGAALFAALPDVDIHAVDIDPVAARCARRNLGRGQVYEGNLYDALPAALQGQVDILVANAPYVPSSAVGLLPVEARVYEPRVALDGGANGLDIVRLIAERAKLWLAENGHLLVETSERQGAQTREMFASNGLLPRVVSSSEWNATVVIGRRSSSAALARDECFD
jgi:release factor glutamine methyltransferase